MVVAARKRLFLFFVTRFSGRCVCVCLPARESPRNPFDVVNAAFYNNKQKTEKKFRFFLDFFFQFCSLFLSLCELMRELFYTTAICMLLHQIINKLKSMDKHDLMWNSRLASFHLFSLRSFRFAWLFVEFLAFSSFNFFPRA